MMQLTEQSIAKMVELLHGRKDNADVKATYSLENIINSMRDDLKQKNIEDVDNRLYSYTLGTLYTDIICECEKLADYVVNVVEARMG